MINKYYQKKKTKKNFEENQGKDIKIFLKNKSRNYLSI